MKLHFLICRRVIATRSCLSIRPTVSFILPNTIEGSSFTGEPFALSYSGLTEKKDGDSKVLMKTGTRVLILEKRLEEGRIFYCAMNLFPRLLDLHKASYELLANLISAGLEQ